MNSPNLNGYCNDPILYPIFSLGLRSKEKTVEFKSSIYEPLFFTLRAILHTTIHSSWGPASSLTHF